MDNAQDVVYTDSEDGEENDEAIVAASIEDEGLGIFDSFGLN